MNLTYVRSLASALLVGSLLLVSWAAASPPTHDCELVLDWNAVAMVWVPTCAGACTGGCAPGTALIDGRLATICDCDGKDPVGPCYGMFVGSGWEVVLCDPTIYCDNCPEPYSPAPGRPGLRIQGCPCL